MSKIGCLLVNLGTPGAPEPKQVGEYLKEFLLDPEVIDIPWIARQLLVRGIIVPFRKKKSAALYQKIWTKEGSPLAKFSHDLREALQKKLPHLVFETAFRYGKPNLEEGLRKLQSSGVDRVIILPLYPQYATSTTRTTLTELKRLGVWERFGRVDFIEEYHLAEFYIESLAQSLRPFMKPERHLLLTFHGIPERHITKNHSGCDSCLRHSMCSSEGDLLCYRRQCTETAKALAVRLGLTREQWNLSFQSRLGREAWLSPSTEQMLNELPARGHLDLVVAAPGFSADCLETLEELDEQGRHIFLSSGGRVWERVPCLNAHPDWVHCLAAYLKSRVEKKES